MKKSGKVTFKTDNIDLFDFELTEEEINEIRWLDTGHNVTGWPSDALTYNPHNN